MMEYIAEKHCIETSVGNREVSTIKCKILDGRRRGSTNIKTNDFGIEHRVQMMCYETVTATDIEHLSTAGQDRRNFECHIVGAPYFLSSSRP
jgi:hypothetical protein